MSGRRRLLTAASVLQIAAGLAELAFSLLGAFSRSTRAAATGAWGWILLFVVLLSGVLTVSAGIIGLYRDVRTGARTLGGLVLGLAAAWFLCTLAAGTRGLWVPAAAAALDAAYLAGVSLSYRV